MIRMTAKEAEKILFNMTDYVEFDEDYGVLFRAPLVDATVRAVKALREEVVHGRWIEVRGRYACSVCKSRALLHFGGIGQNLSPYCPNCGAKMDLEK